MNKHLSLNRTQLKIIAIISMVIDHTAWGFVDFYSPLGQFLHVCGRLTIPIMSFFIAEGFRKTHDLRLYIERMATFAAIAIIPFYIFFHEEYDYRQNIIFDLLLGLLLLTVLENAKLVRWQKVLLTLLLFTVSMTIGGWPVEPMLFILIFYYGRSWKEKVKWFVIADVVMVAFLAVAIYFNSIYHFSHYNWVWWDKAYLLGFMLALPLLHAYNGEKGNDIGGRYFFYLFYPCHFLVLAAIKAIFVTHVTLYQVYAGIHILCFVMCVIIVVLTFDSRPSKGQMAISFFMSGVAIYLFGFILEIYGSTADGYYLACCVQYLGEFLALIPTIYYVSYMCRLKMPGWVLVLHGVIAAILEFLLVDNNNSHIFYSYIGVNNDGPFARPEIGHSTGYYITCVFVAFMCAEILAMCIHVFIISKSRLDKKRVRFILYSLAFCWLPYIFTLSGVTHGYEIPALGLFVSGLFLYLTFIKYGTLDSIALAGENALDHGREGIIVLDDSNRIQYHNNLVDKILGDFPHTRNVNEWPVMARILSGECRSLEVDGCIYDFNIEPLMEKGFEQGKMVWIIDSTEHHRSLEVMAESANRDGLTGLYNRTHFKNLVNEDLDYGKMGTFLMMDMDNFKAVNDHYGHQRGDAVLKNLAAILQRYSEERVFACRVGGDEFCAYLRNTTERAEVENMVTDIMDSFKKTFRKDDDIKCTISVGIIINDGQEVNYKNCSELYSAADKKLYEAKKAGKNIYII